MLTKDTKYAFLSIVRMGLGYQEGVLSNNIDWDSLETLAKEQGLVGIVIDGVDKLPEDNRPPQKMIVKWISFLMKEEARNGYQQKVAKGMALLFHKNSIRTYVLKGDVVAECYPRPEHRVSVDLDCYLLPEGEKFDAWNRGNEIIKSKGYKIETDHYKNSTFYLPKLMVENHRFMVPFRGNKRLKALEQLLQSWMHADTALQRFEGTWLFRPPVMVSALFLIEHAYTHFLHEGLTWRYVLDWMMFKKKHEEEIAWADLEVLINQFGFRRFYDSFLRLGKYLLGEMVEDDLTAMDKKMLADVWTPLDLHETPHGVKGKLALARSTLRARWKYRDFSPISMPHALWIQVNGFLFEKNPTLD